MGKVNKYIRNILAGIGVLILVVMLLLNTPFVQKRVAVIVSSQLENRLGTRVDIGGLHWRIPDNIVIDSILIDDHNGVALLRADRVAAKIEWMPLIREKVISVRNVRLFGPTITAYVDSVGGEPNWQFLLDAFASEQSDTAAASIPSMRINSLLVRRAAFNYDVLSAPVTPGVFNASHIHVTDFDTHLSVRELTADTLSVFMRQFNLREQSGISVDDLSFRLVANRRGATVVDFNLGLPESRLRVDTLYADYSSDMMFKGKILPSTLIPSDLAPFLPGLAEMETPVFVNASFKGNLQQFSVPHLSLRVGKRGVDAMLSAEGDLLPEGNRYLKTEVYRLSVTDSGWQTFAQAIPAVLGPDKERTSSVQTLITSLSERLGNVSVSGNFDGTPSQSSAKLALQSGNGKADVTATLNDAGRYEATVSTHGMDMGQLLAVDELGTLKAALQSKGVINVKDKSLKNADVSGKVAELLYRGYAYSDLDVDGTWDGGAFHARIDSHDPLARLGLVADYAVASAGQKKGSLSLRADHLDPHGLHLTSAYENMAYSFRVGARFDGTNVDDMRGTFALDSFVVDSPDHRWTVDNFTFQSMPEGGRKCYTLRSDFMKASATGYFTLGTLGGSLYNMIGDYESTLVSTLFPKGEKAGRKADKAAIAGEANELSFTLSLNDLSPLSELFHLPVRAFAPITASGYLFESMGKMQIEADVPSVVYDGNRFRNAHLLLSNADGILQLDGKGTLAADNGSSYTAVAHADMADDGLLLGVDWNNSTTGFFEGTLRTSAHFAKDASDRLVVSLNGQPSQAILHGDSWNLGAFHALLSADRYAVSGFNLSNGVQQLAVDGSVMVHPQDNAGADSLVVHLNDIDVASLMAIAPLGGISFGGRVTGFAGVSGLLTKAPRVEARLAIDSLSFCDGYLGDALATVGYNTEGIVFDVKAPETQIGGMASVADKMLDLTVSADSTDIRFLNTLLSGILGDVEGRAYGKLRVHGPFSGLDMEGDLLARDASFVMVPTGARYSFTDYIHFTPGTIRFDDVVVFDEFYDARSSASAMPGSLPHTAILKGAVTHGGLKNWGYDLAIKANDVLGLDIPDNGASTFSTTIFGNGNVHVYGADGQTLHVDVDARTCRNSLFALNLGAGAESGSDFIVFRDRDAIAARTGRRTLPVGVREGGRVRRPATDAVQGGPELAAVAGTDAEAVPDSAASVVAADSLLASTPVRVIGRRRRRVETNAPQPGYEINVHATVTPDATIKLVMDSSTDDNVSAFGSGNLDIRLTSNDLDLRGTYAISRGYYRLNIQDLVYKDFEIVNGSTILFDGDPMESRLDITAQHTVGSVSLADLSADASSMGNVRVNCLLGIGGTPSAPQLTFGLELPQGTEEQKTLMRTYTSTDEQMNLQFIYLLGLGKFYTYDYSQTTQGTQGGASAMQSLLNSTLSGQINNLVSSLLPSDNWNLSGNIRSDNILGTYADEELFSNMEVQGVLEGRLLDNRLLVNGNFGYRDNPMYASNFIGDFDIRYLVVPRSNLWVKGYNKTNDRYFSRTALTTQGIGLMFSKEFDRLFNRKDKLTPTPATEVTDSIATDNQ